MEGSDDSVKVAVNIRPLITSELLNECTDCVTVTPGEPQVKIGAHVFTYDHVYGSSGAQSSRIFEECVLPLVDAFFRGYNATVLAYGQTGSGKTYTMGTNYPGETKADGIIPKVMEEIFEKVNKLRGDREFLIRVSFIEIFKEEVFDLLDPQIHTAKSETCQVKRTGSGPNRVPIQIRETTDGVITLAGVSEPAVKSKEEMASFLAQGSLNRATAGTNMNSQSSRSHAIFTIYIEQKRTACSSQSDAGDDILISKLHLVDLAGSERAKRTGADGSRLKEGIEINKGLLSLGNVISALGDEKKRKEGAFVPYRDSKLTRLLQDSLGGNSKTVMIACISPTYSNAQETINTLKFANRARNIRNKAVINRDPVTAEMQRLRSQLEQLQGEHHFARSHCASLEESQAKKEISLLKQEKLQLQSELDIAVRASQDAQALLSAQAENAKATIFKDEEFKSLQLQEGFEIEMQKLSNEAASKMEAVLKRTEEQRCMIESLHTSVTMYKRLYEEERKSRNSSDALPKVLPGNGDIVLQIENSQAEVSKNDHNQLVERARKLEEDLTALRNETTTLRIDRDKMALQAEFSKERLNSSMAELENQRKEANAASARNMELMHLIVDYQKRLHESSDSVQVAEENARKFSLEVSILKHQKEILANSEKRAMEEVRNLSDKVLRLQSTLDTIQTTEEVRESARATERQKQADYIKQLEQEFAEAKKELQEEKDHVRTLTVEKEKTIETSMKQIEEMRKELSDAWRSVSSAETRADAWRSVSLAETRAAVAEGGRGNNFLAAANVVDDDLRKVKEELGKVREEAQANKDYVLQYKEIAQTNEAALKQIESVHEEYKSEAEKSKKSLEDEVTSLRSKLSELEKTYKSKCQEAASAIEEKDKQLFSLELEISVLNDEISENLVQIEALQTRTKNKYHPWTVEETRVLKEKAAEYKAAHKNRQNFNWQKIWNDNKDLFHPSRKGNDLKNKYQCSK